MQKGIYVKDDDVGLWERAEAYARARRLTMSALIMNALQAYIEDDQDDEDRSR